MNEILDAGLWTVVGFLLLSIGAVLVGIVREALLILSALRRREGRS